MSSTATSGPSKTPLLSYAERAKKAQNIKSPSSAPNAARIVTTSSTGPASTASTSSVASLNATRSASAASADNPTTSAIKQNASPSSPIPSTTPTSVVAARQTSGEGLGSLDHTAKRVSGANPEQSLPKPPVPNIWNARMASRSAVQSSSASPSTTNIGKSQSTTFTSPTKVSENGSRSFPTIEVTSSRSDKPTAVTGSRKDDHITGRPSTSKSRIPSPPAIDSEAWPEVGKSPPTDQGSSTSQATLREGNDENAGKKGDKPKWVPIPAEELQAAADAILKSSRPQSRKSSRGPSRKNDPRNPGQPRTRNNSGRNSASQSASQSRVQSRSESLQSSPRFPRGRRLPPDDGHHLKPNGTQVPPGNAKIPPRSPRPRSPPTEKTPSYALPPQSSSLDPLNIVPPVFPLSQSSSFSPHTYGVYPPPPHGLPPPHLIHGAQFPPSLSQHDSPSLHIYPLPPAPYPPPFPGLPQYAPYEYSVNGLATPFWNGTYQPRPEQHIPVYPPNNPNSTPSPLQQHRNTNQINGRPDSRKSSPTIPKPAAKSTDNVVGDTPPKISELNSSGEKPVVFGTIAVTDVEAPPAGEFVSTDEARTESLESSFTKFSIGLSPDEVALGRPSRTHSNKGRGRTGTTSESPIAVKDVPDDNGKEDGGVDTAVEGSNGKWEFGTTSSQGLGISDESRGGETGPRLSPISNSISPAQLPLGAGIPASHSGIPLDRPVTDVEGEFRVRDFGYGFGQPGGSVVDPARIEQLQREIEQQRIALLPRTQDQRPLSPSEESHTPNNSSHKGRRPFNNSGDHGGHVGRRGGGGSGRGSTNGNGSGFGGRGQVRHQRSNSFQVQPHIPPRQPLISITPPPFQQPIVHGNENPSNYYALPLRPPIGPHLPPSGFDTYALPQAAPPVVPHGPQSPHSNPPVPVPMTTLSFPLDPTRYYLLGQLEYYLSPQNMVQDFFLRQRMDSFGWIPIPLIASFNRIRRLTVDVNLVREVLYLSTVVQVLDNWVRMGGWERYVLPDAAPSAVDDGEGGPHYHPPAEAAGQGRAFPQDQPQYGYTPQLPQVVFGERERYEYLPRPPEVVVRELYAPALQNHGQRTGGHEGEDEDSEEDDVVFVMGNDSELPPFETPQPPIIPLSS